MSSLVHSGQEAVIPGCSRLTTADQRLTSLAAHVAAFAHGRARYGDQPYLKHLTDVTDILTAWGCDAETVAAGWLHDVVEDTRLSAGIIFDLFGPRVGWLVSAVSGYGETRSARLAHIYYEIQHVTPEAAVVKLADRIANVEAAPAGSKHLARYVREQDGFAEVVQPLVAAEQWDRLEAAFASKAASSDDTQPGTSAASAPPPQANELQSGKDEG